MSKREINLPSYRPPVEDYKTDYGIGIIGYGKIVKRLHMPAYKYAGFNVVAASAKSEESCSDAKAQGIKNVSGNYMDIINDNDVDIIDLSIKHVSPFDELRLEILKAAADKGKHVLVQKPLAENIKFAEEMVSIAEKGGIMLAVNQQARFNPVPYAINGLLADEYIGRPGIIELENIQKIPVSGKYMEFGDTIIPMNFAIHHTDIIRWWAKGKPVSVFSTMSAKSAMVIYEFDNNTKAYHHEINSNSMKNKTPIKIWAEKGSIEANTRWNPWCNWEPDFLDVKFADDPAYVKNISYNLPGDEYDPYNKKRSPFELSAPLAGFNGVMADLMDSIDKKKKPVTDARDNLLSLKMWLAAQKSAEEKRVIKIEEIK